MNSAVKPFCGKQWGIVVVVTFKDVKELKLEKSLMNVNSVGKILSKNTSVTQNIYTGF